MSACEGGFCAAPESTKGIHVRFDMRLLAPAAALLGATLAVGAPAVGAEASALPVYAAEAPTPRIDHVIRRVHVRECTRDPKEAHSGELRSLALAELSRKALAMGANGLTRVEVKVLQSNTQTLPKGAPNPCLFETDAKGDAAVLNRGEPDVSQVAAQPR